MTPRIGALIIVLLVAGCSVAQDPLLPPLARVPVPAMEPRPLPPKPKPEPAVLVGQTEDEVLAFLGRPDLARREAPAEIWRYGDETCGIHLFFYHDGEVLKVTHVETRIDGSGPETPAQCLDTLRSASGGALDKR